MSTTKPEGWMQSMARMRREDAMTEREISVTTWRDAWSAYVEMCGSGEPSITSEELHAERIADPGAPAYGADGWHAWLGAAWDRHETPPHYRACYWISDDGQAEVRLTTEDMCWWPDADLLTAARAEAAQVGCDLTTGRLVIGNWCE